MAAAPRYKDGLHLQLGSAGVACFFAQGTVKRRAGPTPSDRGAPRSPRLGRPPQVHWVETTMVRQQLAPGAQRSMARTIADIVKTEGPLALYRGFAAAGLRELSYSSLRFGLYEPLKKALGATDPATTPFYKKVLAGLLAGAFASAVASPTDLLKIRAQAATGPRESIVEHAKHIANGPSKPWPLNFYRGVSATIVRASCLGATKMATYDQTKAWLRVKCGWRDSVPVERYKLQGSAAVATGLAITIATSPATNARTFIMAHPPGQYGHVGKALVAIVQQRGFLGLFRGFGAQWARFGPYALVQYFCWEKLRDAAGMRPL